MLDNCEHLRDACAEVAAALLAACPRLRLLATSRAALGLPGEAVWRVPSLRVPAALAGLLSRRDLADLAAVPAVRLFLERVRQRQPGFTLATATASPIAEIARRLDGIPLALELAAARVAVLPVAELAARLDHALALLGGGARAAAPRHRTLRATLDWSHALLAPPQQALLRRLSVFAGGAALAAIEAVCADASSDTGNGLDFSILDALDALVDHSLVQADLEVAGGRYRLLETVRQYAAERLAATGEELALREIHAAHYLALAEELAAHSDSADAPGWVGAAGARIWEFARRPRLADRGQVGPPGAPADRRGLAPLPPERPDQRGPALVRRRQ